jgi:transcriptional regulator with XRE-family HTH domain
MRNRFGKLIVTKLGILRFERGITQKELAQEMGFSASMVNQIERRRIALWPSCLKKLSEYYGVTPEEIMDEDGFARKWETGA